MVHKAHLEASLHAYVLKNIPPKQKQTTKKKMVKINQNC